MEAKELKSKIEIVKKDIKEIIMKLNKTIENMEYFYNISNDIINNYDNKKINYEILYNINNIFNNNIIKDINYIINESSETKIIKILDIYDKLYDKGINKLKIYYKIDKKDKKIKLFGKQFVENNKENCKILIEGKEYELMEYFNLKNCKEIKDKLEITLIGIKNITDMSFMFGGEPGVFSSEECKVFSIPDISKWNTSKVFNMRGVFDHCSHLESLPDISKWNTSNVIYMALMFNGCSSLKSLPDISKWNTPKLEETAYMFSGCKQLSEIPKIHSKYG